MIIAGNWKMNMTRSEAISCVGQIMAGLPENSPHQALVFPPAILIAPVIDACQGTAAISVGGQDCHAALQGAHTGDISASMLKDAGCSHVILGHSERRSDHGETSADVAAKAVTALGAGLKAIICVGETLAEREADQAQAVVETQIRESLPAEATIDNTIVAYEPVWAIGTGKVAEIEDIAVMHAHIHAVLTSLAPSLGQVSILYGGSVKPGNAAGIFAVEHVGGALVGGASLKADDFLAILAAAD